jgi:hypothetical protein
MFENKMPRIFELKKDEILGSRRKLHNEAVHDL